MTANCFILEVRDLNEFVWQKSHSTKTPSTSRARKCKIESRSKLVFIFICEVILCS